MQSFWIEKYYIPLEKRSDNGFDTMEVSIPDDCQHCGLKINIHANGNSFRPGTIINPCLHYSHYRRVWENRIINKQAEQPIMSKVTNYFDDGCKCNKCGLWYSMAAPNQSDNTFKCYLCRTRGW